MPPPKQANVAILLERFDSIAKGQAELQTMIQVLRTDFNHYAERNGERLTKIELAAQEQETLLKVTREELTAYRQIATDVATLKTSMAELQQIKLAVFGNVIGLIVVGSLMAWVLLK